jgi:transposase-like protein
MKCPYCGSSNVERVKEWDMPKMGYHVTHYICRNCGGRFNHYVGRGREFMLRVGFKR